MNEQVSGNIFAEKDNYRLEGEIYIIRSPITGQGFGLPVRDIEPDDLRKLADRIEQRRKRAKGKTK